MALINAISTPQMNNVAKLNFGNTAEAIDFETKAYRDDEVEFTNQTQAPNIGFFRITFNYLSDEQIKQVNESGKLPKNAKFIPDGMGGYRIHNNFFGIRHGTQQLPAGFELKRSLLGFTVVVPKGTDGLFIRN